MDYNYEIFLSHSSANKKIARRLANELRYAGFSVWFDEWILQIGDDIYLKIEDGINQSQAMLLLMSKDYFASEWATMERSTAAFRSPSNMLRPLIPIVIEECQIPDALKRIHHFILCDFEPPTIDSLVSRIALRIGATDKKRTTFIDKINAAPEIKFERSGSMAEAYYLMVSEANAAPKSILLYIDVDGFTYINAKHSVLVGEAVLETIKILLNEVMPSSAKYSKWRADEFVAIIPGIDERQGLKVANDLMKKIQCHPWNTLSNGMFVTASCGVSGKTRRSKLSDVEWIERAILGCRAAKLKGGSQAKLGDSIQSTAEEKVKKTLSPLSYLAKKYSSDDEDVRK